MGMFSWLNPAKWFKKKPKYIYGSVQELGTSKFQNVRLNQETNRVEFVMWKAGEQGHVEDYWYPMDSYWNQFFVPHYHSTIKEKDNVRN